MRPFKSLLASEPWTMFSIQFVNATKAQSSSHMEEQKSEKDFLEKETPPLEEESLRLSLS